MPKALLEFLERQFPVQMPVIDEHDRSIWIRTGRQEIIGILRAHYDKQHLSLIKE